MGFKLRPQLDCTSVIFLAILAGLAGAMLWRAAPADAAQATAGGDWTADCPGRGGCAARAHAADVRTGASAQMALRVAPAQAGAPASIVLEPGPDGLHRKADVTIQVDAAAPFVLAPGVDIAAVDDGGGGRRVLSDMLARLLLDEMRAGERVLLTLKTAAGATRRLEFSTRGLDAALGAAARGLRAGPGDSPAPRVRADAAAQADNPVAACWAKSDALADLSDCLGDAWQALEARRRDAMTGLRDQALAIDRIAGSVDASRQLDAADGAWRAFVDANCDLWGAFAPGASGPGRGATACAIRMTQERIGELQDLADGRDPILESIAERPTGSAVPFESFFTPAIQGPPAGSCFESQKVFDGDGVLLGWVTYALC